MLIKSPNIGEKWFFCYDCKKVFTRHQWYVVCDHVKTKGHDVRTLSENCKHIIVEG
jgi:hypothetical protein